MPSTPASTAAMVTARGRSPGASGCSFARASSSFIRPRA